MLFTAAIILIWFLSNFGWAFWNGMVDINDSILASLGKILQFLFYPTGWAIGEDGWKYTVSAITGLIAKEEVVATLATLGIVEGNITLSTAGIYAFAAYNLFTLPCFAAIGAIKQETNSWKWALISIALPTIIGIILCFIIVLV